MIFSLNDVVKKYVVNEGKANFYCQSTFIKHKTTMKMYYGHASFCETYIRYFSMIPPIFFVSFFLAIYKHLNFTVCSAVLGPLRLMVLYVRMFSLYRCARAFEEEKRRDVAVDEK